MTPTNSPHTKRSVVSETEFPSRANLETIKAQLRSIRATGKLVVNFSQGGLNSITFEARQSINGDDHVELKFVPAQVNTNSTNV